ncbi:MAG: MotA/TolQ/ExbB proton channel family protein [Thermovirgaceae bacterium]|jgi:biopolymer transport protein ExbB|nr:MotA/TolQ/ExbB proton channel family protein [Synergistales bacterium]MDI9392964.1 MotA/TolQ/ExbB proton channel family protein [Synergistota bacterium]NLV65506.1 MotA/TolQ/ExbB proton channel family protein [Synergistaceae bacterium]HRW87550.1 MotA/TolQ/ExbB proton channel family protein [Thermovirgaceae bacterium]MDD3134460.1 MotA/TolQ/ExbB proton channel family protein [Synergistales bacterium]
MELMDLGGPVMWVILGLSVLGGAIVLERLWFIFRASTDPSSLELALGDLIYHGKKEDASRLVRGSDSSLHRLFRVAVDHWEVDPEAMQVLLEQEVRREIFRWERGLGFLATIARVTPLLGLLGTVIGMIDVFRNLPGMTGSSMAVMAGGIWKALLTTVAGLSVAVPLILFHAFLSVRLERAEEMLWRGVDFMVREKVLRSDRNEGPDSQVL